MRKFYPSEVLFLEVTNAFFIRIFVGSHELTYHKY